MKFGFDASSFAITSQLQQLFIVPNALGMAAVGDAHASEQLILDETTT